jgi:hypothetical protein
MFAFWIIAAVAGFLTVGSIVCEPRIEVGSDGTRTVVHACERLNR